MATHACCNFMQDSSDGSCQSVTAAKIVVNVEVGQERMGLLFENVFAATKDEDADIAAAFRSTDAADVPCNAHVQQTAPDGCESGGSSDD